MPASGRASSSIDRAHHQRGYPPRSFRAGETVRRDAGRRATGRGRDPRSTRSGAGQAAVTIANARRPGQAPAVRAPPGSTRQARGDQLQTPAPVASPARPAGIAAAPPHAPARSAASDASALVDLQPRSRGRIEPSHPDPSSRHPPEQRAHRSRASRPAAPTSPARRPTTAAITSVTVSPPNARRPVSIS